MSTDVSNGGETLTSRKGWSVTLKLTDGEAVVLLDRDFGDKPESFPAKLVREYYKHRSLSYEQRCWLHKLANERLPGAQDENTLEADLSELRSFVIAAYERCKEKAAGRQFRVPTLTFHKVAGVPGGVRIRLSPASGKIQVSSCGSWDDRIWYGSINDQGRFVLSGRLTDEASIDALEKFLADVSASPDTATAQFGKDTGWCCFCASELTDPRSILHGYGPICADRWGLPQPYDLNKADAQALLDAMRAQREAECETKGETKNGGAS